MLPIIRLICLTFSLLVLLTGCAQDNPRIRPASEAATSGSAGSGRVTLTWDRVMAESFNLYLATVPGKTESGRKISNAAAPFQITDLSTGATYYIGLTALNNGEISLRTEEIAHTVKSPDDRITLSFAGRTTEITLAWDDSEQAAAYNIYWHNTPGVTRQNGIKIPNVQNPHTLTGLIPGVTYYFAVTAVGKSGYESGVSEEIVYIAK